MVPHYLICLFLLIILPVGLYANEPSDNSDYLAALKRCTDILSASNHDKISKLEKCTNALISNYGDHMEGYLIRGTIRAEKKEYDLSLHDFDTAEQLTDKSNKTDLCNINYLKTTSSAANDLKVIKKQVKRALSLCKKAKNQESIDDLERGLSKIVALEKQQRRARIASAWNTFFTGNTSTPRTGQPSPSACESGHWVATVSDRGQVVKLENGSIWRINATDAVQTMLWLPTTDIIACNDKLINTNDNESVAATRIR